MAVGILIEVSMCVGFSSKMMLFLNVVRMFFFLSVSIYRLFLKYRVCVNCIQLTTANTKVMCEYSECFQQDKGIVNSVDKCSPSPDGVILGRGVRKVRFG